MRVIAKENGDKTMDKSEITAEFHKFYTKKEKPEGEEYVIPDTYFRKLEEEEKKKMEEGISTSEVRESIIKLNNIKSPGPDGLTREFCKTFNEQLAPVLHLVIRKIYEANELPEEMAQSYITIIPKGKADKTQIKYYRPLSLLNSDYKIISNILTERIKPHMGKPIHTDQQCAVKGRKIQHHLHNLRDTITYCRDKGKMISHVLYVWKKKSGKNFVRVGCIWSG